MRRVHTQSPASRLLARSCPVVIGHRGYSQFAPENTLPSFELAMAAGADLVELDFQQSQDGVLMVAHDAELSRTSDARRRWKQRNNRVDSKTALEIQDLDAGSWFSHRFAGVGVPTLGQALELIRKRSIALIERKSGTANAVVELLREKRLINKVIVQSFDWAFLRSVHALAPEQIIGALGPPKVLCTGRKPSRIFGRLNGRLSGAWLREMQQTGAKIAVWNQQVSQKAIRLAHEQDMKVWVYTVNTEHRATRLLRIGVDGMISDNPSLIWKATALASRKRLPEH